MLCISDIFCIARVKAVLLTIKTTVHNSKLGCKAGKTLPDEIDWSMSFEEALEFIESALESKSSKTLSLLEKDILKAAWKNATYSALAESL
jgi:hypothetical protein